MKRWTSLVTKHPIWILVMGGLIVALAGVWGLGVFKHLSNGGFEDPDSSSIKSRDIIARELPSKRTDLIVLFTSHWAGVIDPRVSAVIKDDLTTLSNAPGVTQVVSYYS